MKTLAITNPLQGLTWLQTAEYVLLTLAVAALPVKLSVAVYAAYAVIATAVVRIVATRTTLRQVVAARCRATRLSLLGMIVLWGLYAASLLFTSNMTEGVLRVGKLLPLLAFGLYYLVADPAIYTAKRIRTTLWLFTAELLAIFAVALVRMLYSLVILGKDYSSLNGANFYIMHHAYIAYYVLTAMVFVYSECLRLWHGAKTWQRWALIVAELSLAAFAVVVNSRAGVIGLVLIATLAIAHLALVRHRWRAALLLAATVAALWAAAVTVLPRSELRVHNTIINNIKGDSDARVYLYHNALKAVAAQPMGYGAGDYVDVLCESYARDDKFNPLKERMNSHNQYLDTTLATGVAGLLVLLASLAVYGVAAWRRRNVAAVFFMVITAESIFFEAMFYRQIGVMFFILVYGLLAIAPETKKVPQLKKI